jgi:AcrR family transcriptional regulator
MPINRPRAAAPRARRKKRRTGAGRPEGESFARNEILAMAEAAFAEHGYAGTSLKLIADKTAVTQALITYYFQSKEALFKEVFMRRGREIAEKRLAALEAVRRRKRFTLRDVVVAYLRPALEMRRTDEGRAFIRLQARMHTEPPEFADQLRKEVYNDTVREYLPALRQAAPHLSARTLFWRMILTVGAYLYAHSDAHRLDSLSGGVANPDDAEEMLEQITDFVVGGFQAQESRAASRPRRFKGTYK